MTATRQIPSLRLSILSTLVACTLLALSQVRTAIQLQYHHSRNDNIDMPHQTTQKHPTGLLKQSSQSDKSFQEIPHLSKNQSFGACLMVKDDDDLLYEWLAYHYTTLPLRYVLIASDFGSQSHPDHVLQRWKIAKTGLDYWIVSASNFTTHNIPPPTIETNKNNDNNNATTTTASTMHDDHHHALLSRQRDFITYCVKFMKNKGLHWVSLIDTDEYVVLNPLGENETLPIRPSNDPNAVDPIYHQLRTHPSLDIQRNNKSVLEIIHDVESIKDLSPCYTMPRVLHGALENVTCPNAQSDIALAKNEGFDMDNLQTLRFHQHAPKGDFATSKFGKVFLDVSSLSDSVLERNPKSPHRPYKPECRPGVVHFPEAMFYINHYLGSWERYAARKDGRRNRDEWEQRAYLTAATSCDKHVTRWFSRFVDLVGMARARYLLGVRDDFL